MEFTSRRGRKIPENSQHPQQVGLQNWLIGAAAKSEEEWILVSTSGLFSPNLPPPSPLRDNGMFSHHGGSLFPTEKIECPILSGSQTSNHIVTSSTTPTSLGSHRRFCVHVWNNTNKNINSSQSDFVAYTFKRTPPDYSVSSTGDSSWKLKFSYLRQKVQVALTVAGKSVGYVGWRF